MAFLKTAEEVVKALGGLERVCEIAEANTKQAWHWHGRAGQFPSNTYFVMQRALRRRGHEAPAHLWKMKGAKQAA